jgi:hypothetical protein
LTLTGMLLSLGLLRFDGRRYALAGRALVRDLYAPFARHCCTTLTPPEGPEGEYFPAAVSVGDLDGG